MPGPDGNWDYASIDSDARRLYVAHGDAVIAVDLDTGALNPRLIGGDRLHAVLPLPGGRVLSTNGGADDATLFEGATGREIARIPTGRRPDGALAPKTGRIYLPTADFTAPAPGEKRGALIPGAFRILLVGEK